VTFMLSAKGMSLGDSPLTPEKLVSMISLIEKGTISNTAGKTVLEEILAAGGEPEDIVKAKGLAQVSGGAQLEEAVKAVLAQNEKSVADYKRGKTNAIGFLVGQCMRATKGKGNPQAIREMLIKELDKA
jgi:aspartyl-tRNA(Asn)/glutamyl-tRNA(Gln) amidotransferase subunit B